MRSMTTHNQSHGEQPGAENDGATVGAQPQPAELDMSSFSEEQLLAAITGDSPPTDPSAATTVEQSDTSQTPDDGAQPEPNPANQGQQGKNDSIRLRLSALPPEEQKEAAEAYRLVREGKAPDLFEAYKQLRGTKESDTDPNAQQQAAPQEAAKPAIVSELETQLSEARARLKEARDTFDADAEDAIEAEIQTLVRKLAKEEIKAELENTVHDKKQGKRKKDGVFYTPEYITRYIVEEAVGGWLSDRKTELGIDPKSGVSQKLPELTEDDFIKKGKKPSKNAQKHIDFWNYYAKILQNIKVLDPACGSGAFLVAVFNFLENEWLTLSETLRKLGDDEQAGLFSYSQVYKNILKNNIYGVDLNPESVQITKLSL